MSSDYIQLKIDESNRLYNNKYVYTLVNFQKMIDKVSIICREHGIFVKTMHKHLSGEGCPTCSKQISSQKRIIKQQLIFIQKATLLYKSLYDYSKVSYISAKSKIIVTCNRHGDFMITPNKHLNGESCPSCTKEQVSLKLRYPLDKFLEEVRLKHNHKYDYSKVVWKGVDKNIIIICHDHGEFTIKASEHRERGCKNCATTNNHPNLLGIDEFIKRHKEKHGDKYNYDQTIYNGIDKLINITCPNHGIYSSIAVNLSGCNICKENVRNNQLKEEAKRTFINKSNNVHNFTYDYSQTNYINASTKVKIKCKKHGIFEITPCNHLYGKGCSWCAKQFSMISISWLDYLSKKNNIYIQHANNIGEYTILGTKYKADGYCKDTNTIYEFHGDYWHGNPHKYNQHSINAKTGTSFKELYDKTKFKEDVIKSKGYNLIIMWEMKWKNFIKIVIRIQRIYKNRKINKK
jgi:hypothetical protein